MFKNISEKETPLVLVEFSGVVELKLATFFFLLSCGLRKSIALPCGLVLLVDGGIRLMLLILPRPEIASTLVRVEMLNAKASFLLIGL